MPRRKQKLDNPTIVENSNGVEETTLRRSKRKPVNAKNIDQKPKVDQTISKSKKDDVIKTPRSSIKRLKTEETSSPELKHSSPDSVDSGISSELSLKDKSYSLSKFSKTPTETELLSLKKPYNMPSVSDDNSAHSDVRAKISSEKTKLQKNRKRKIDDVVDPTISSNENKKPLSKQNIRSKDKSAEFHKELKVSKISLESTAIKKEEPFLGESNYSTFVGSAACTSSIGQDTILQVLTQQEFDEHSECKTSSLKKLRHENCDNESSSESDWEEVEEKKELSLDDYNPVIPKDGVEITIDCPELNVRKRKKKQFDHMEYIRLYINRERKEHQLNIQKTHLLCLLAHGLYVNDILNSLNLKALALSYLPFDILAVTTGRKIDKANSDVIQSVVSWFCESFSFEYKQLPFINFEKSMPTYFEGKKSLSPSEYNLMFLVFARTLGFKTRFCVSFYPVSHKAKNLLKKPGSKKKNSRTEHNSQEEQDLKDEKVISTVQESTKKKLVVTAKNKNNSQEKQDLKDEKPIPTVQESSKKKLVVTAKNKKIKSDVTATKKKSHPRRSASKNYKMSSDEDDVEDKDFVEKTHKRMKHAKTTGKKLSEKSSNRRVISSDSEPDSPENCSFKEDKILCWCEVFSKPDKRWISIECTNKIVDKPYEIEKFLPQPVTYILAYDNDSYIKDVTRRYCNEYMTSTLKLRADSDWWEETLEYFAPPNSKLDKEEEKKLDEMLENKPLPKTIGEYKNHPLYALKRHLLKFEGIYPPNAAPVGYIREEPVYARDNVCKLHSRETWVKEARVVRAGQEPYKIVKARPKWDRIAGLMRTDLPLEVFGFWQTDEYEPPVAVDGKVPRNEYGNVELFKACMLPRGTVHLQLPGLNRIAKKLGIDCSSAVVGFDGHKGSIHPVYDGFVVCKEFKDTLLAAWDEEQVNARKREEEKREKRIYGNWKKLIKGLLIRERIKLKYDVK